MSEWKTELSKLLQARKEKAKQNRELIGKVQEQAKAFLNAVVVPALEEFREEIVKHGRQAKVQFNGLNGAGIEVSVSTTRELDYSIKLYISPDGFTAAEVKRFRNPADGKLFRGESPLGGSADGTVHKHSKESILKRVFEAYKASLK